MIRSSLQTLLSTKPATKFNSYVFGCVSLLKNLTNQGLDPQGTALHGHLLKTGTSSERYIAVRLFIMYLNSRKSAEADKILEEFNGFDLVVHNCMITANVRWGNVEEARRVFDEMPERNEVSWTALISGLMKCGRVEEAIRYFERNPFRDVFSWTAVISGCLQNGFSFWALMLFLELIRSGTRPNEVTFTSVVTACAEMGEFELGMSILGLIVKAGLEHHLSVSNSLVRLGLRAGEMDFARDLFDKMEKRDVVSWTTILDIYVEKGDLGEARRIFDEMPERNEVSWSAMIARYCQSGYPEEALNLFQQMVQGGFKPSSSCFSSVLSALAGIKGLQAGMNIHGHVTKIGMEQDVYVTSSLIDMYCKCGETKDGRVVFDFSLEKNVVSWNAMIGGYSVNGQMEEAKQLFATMPQRNNISWSAIIAGYLDSKEFDKVFELFNEMLLLGKIPNKSTFSSLLSACASIASLEKGKDLHGKIVKLGIHDGIIVGTALADMYAKSGDIESCKRVFDTMQEKNEFTWTVMIQGLAESGFAEESLDLFEEMKRTSLVAPNELMLLTVLCACSHSGLVDRGLEYFNSMETIYRVKQKGKHYTCVVDMLSRAGRLLEAEELINSMPFQPEPHALAALLNGCKMHKNEELAERTAKTLWEMAEEDASGYVLLSNIYASAGRWTDVLKVRKLMKGKGLRKSGGCSWIEVKNQVHSFYSEDGNHPHSAEIYEILQLLSSEILIIA